MTKISLDELIAMLPQDGTESFEGRNAWEMRVLHDSCSNEITICHRGSGDRLVSEELIVTFPNGKQRVRLWVRRDGDSVTNSDLSLASEIAAYAKARLNLPIKFYGMGNSGYQRINKAREEIETADREAYLKYMKK